MRAHIALAGFAFVSIAAGCSFGPEEIAHLSASESVTIEIVDERGQPIVGAAYDYGGVSTFTDETGAFRLRLCHAPRSASTVGSTATSSRSTPRPSTHCS